MPSSTFTFKEFKIKQDRCAMKVGTDGVLLGAWTPVENNINSILDIGTGTGLISLQLAQRSEAETIDALEIETDAFEQAVENFENSDWGDRLFCYHASLQEFVEEIDEKYDLIVSNPPFYNDTYRKLDQKRAMARHTEQLTFEDLLSGIKSLLADHGTAAVIIPYKEENQFLRSARNKHLFPKKISRYSGHRDAEIKRSLIQLSHNEEVTTEESFFLEHSRHDYSDHYKNLVKDFYLKL